MGMVAFRLAAYAVVDMVWRIWDAPSAAFSNGDLGICF